MVTRGPRMTGPTRAVLEAFLADPETDHYGLGLGAATRLPSGTIHPILARLEGVEWLASTWEDVDPADAGRPRRRLYRLTDTGLQQATAALRDLELRRAHLTRRHRAATASS